MFIGFFVKIINILFSLTQGVTSFSIKIIEIFSFNYIKPLCLHLLQQLEQIYMCEDFTFSGNETSGPMMQLTSLLTFSKKNQPMMLFLKFFKKLTGFKLELYTKKDRLNNWKLFQDYVTFKQL